MPRVGFVADAEIGHSTNVRVAGALVRRELVGVRLEEAEDRERLFVPILFECVLAADEIVAIRGAAGGSNDQR